jgi:hypothetical protein
MKLVCDVYYKLLGSFEEASIELWLKINEIVYSKVIFIWSIRKNE